MRGGLVALSSVLLAACATAGPSAPPPAPATTQAPDGSVGPSATAPLVTLMPLKTGWPTIGRSGVTMTATAQVEPPPFEGCPGPAPALVVTIALTGLAPGEEVWLAGAATYDFGMLACGVQPSPCVWGSGTTDPAVHLCRPEYSEAVRGMVGTSATATADATGSAAATVRFVIPASQRACPAGSSRAWFLGSGTWLVRVTDTAHGLRLVGPPDLVIGP